MAWWLKPLHEVLLATALSYPKLFTDDTPFCRCSIPGSTTKTQRLWTADVPWDGPAPPVLGGGVWVRQNRRKGERATSRSRGFDGICKSMGKPVTEKIDSATIGQASRIAPRPLDSAGEVGETRTRSAQPRSPIVWRPFCSCEQCRFFALSGAFTLAQRSLLPVRRKFLLRFQQPLANGVHVAGNSEFLHIVENLPDCLISLKLGIVLISHHGHSDDQSSHRCALSPPNGLRLHFGKVMPQNVALIGDLSMLFRQIVIASLPIGDLFRASKTCLSSLGTAMSLFAAQSMYPAGVILSPSLPASIALFILSCS